MKTLPSLQKISLQNKKLTDKGVENLAQDLKKLTNLQNIGLQFQACEGLTGTGFQSFGQNLTSLSQLQTFRLDFTE